jgi:3-hydroxyacyl-CoA dehydrogenase
LSKVAKTSKATVAVTGSFARKIANEHEPLVDNKLSPFFIRNKISIV